MHRSTDSFDDSQYPEGDKVKAREYAQKRNILSLSKKTEGTSLQSVANPYSSRREAVSDNSEGNVVSRQIQSIGGVVPTQLLQRGATIDHEAEHYRAYLQGASVSRKTMFARMVEEWQTYEEAAVSNVGVSLKGLNLQDMEESQKALEAKARRYAMQVVSHPEQDTGGFEQAYNTFLFAEPDAQDALEQSVSHPTQSTSTTFSPDDNSELLAVAYAERMAERCPASGNRDDWFGAAYQEYMVSSPQQRTFLESQLHFSLQVSRSAQSPYSVSASMLPSFNRSTSPLQRVTVEQYVERAHRAMPDLSKEELKQIYLSTPPEHFQGLIQTLIVLESDNNHDTSASRPRK